MRSHHKTALIALITAAALALPSAAMGDATLTMTGTKGAMTVTEWHVSGERSGSGGYGSGGGADVAKINDVAITKPLDANTPKLFEFFVMGTHQTSAVLTVRKVSGKTAVKYMTYCLSDVIVSSFDDSSTGGREPQEKLTLNSPKIALSYTPYSSTGIALTPLSIGWNVMTNMTFTPSC